MVNLKEALKYADGMQEKLFEAEENNVLTEAEETADDKMTDEELKIESLKIATNIAKLMSDVTTDDILTIATKVSDFIRNHEVKKAEETTQSI